MSRISIKTVAIAASKQVSLSSMVVLLLAVAATPWALAQTYDVLHRFHGKADGNYPSAGVIRDAAGNLYGTTVWGGDRHCNPDNVPPWLRSGFQAEPRPQGNRAIHFSWRSGRGGSHLRVFAPGHGG